MSNLRRGGRAVGVAVLLSIAGILGTVVTSLAVLLALDASGVTLTPEVQLLLFVPGFLGFVLVGGLYLAYRGLGLPYVGVRVPSLSDLLWTGVGYVSAFAIVVVSGLVLSAIEVEPDATNTSAEFGMNNPDLLLWMIPLMLFVVAPAEEFLFRGVIQSRLRETFVAPVAIAITAALFASLHYFALTGGTGGRLVAVAILFFPSLVFGIVYERTGNLVPGVIVHGVYNSTLVLLIWVTLQLPDTAGAGTAFL